MKGELIRFFLGFRFATRGIKLCIQEEKNFRFHLCAACYVALFGMIAEFSRQQFCILFLCFGLMFGAEGANTAIERLCDRITEKYDEKIRNIKDIAAGTVLCCAVICAFVGFFLFADRAVWSMIILSFQLHKFNFVLLVLSVPVAFYFIFLTGRKEK